MDTAGGVEAMNTLGRLLGTFCDICGQNLEYDGHNRRSCYEGSSLVDNNLCIGVLDSILMRIEREVASPACGRCE
jgi:hypothetical protein